MGNEIISLILNALSAGFVAATQDTINGAVNEAYRRLKTLIQQKFAGKGNEEEVKTLLSNYEEHRESTIDLLRYELINQHVDQDSEIVELAKKLQDQVTLQHQGDQYNFNGPVMGGVFGGVSGGTIIQNIGQVKKDEIAEGKALLKEGQSALLYDTQSAKRALDEAINLLRANSQPVEAAKARFLLALARLGKRRPYVHDRQVMLHIEKILDAAIQIHPINSYYLTLAIFNCDFFTRRSLRPHLCTVSQLLGKVQAFRLDSQDVHILQQQMGNNLRQPYGAYELFSRTIKIKRHPEDEENFEILSKCQLELFHSYFGFCIMSNSSIYLSISNDLK